MRKLFRLFGSVCLILGMVSCSDLLSSGAKETSLAVRLPSVSSSRAAETAMPEWATQIDYFEVVLEPNSQAGSNGRGAEAAATDASSSGEKSDDSQGSQKTESAAQNSSSIKKTGKPGGTVQFEGLAAGEYTVKVLAYEAGSTDAVAGGEEQARVEEGRRTAVSVTVSKYDSEDEEELEVEITYGGTVSFNGTEYGTLSEALIAAKTATSSKANTITLNGNVKETFLQMGATASPENFPWLISQNLVLDLDGHTFCWDEFNDETKNDYTTSEKYLFSVSEGTTLVIRNGTILSDSSVRHSSFLIATSGGTVVFDNVTIKDIHTSIESLILISATTGGTKGSLYCNKVNIKDCSATYSSDSYPIHIHGSYFYASETNIENLLGTVSVFLYNTQGSFVGGSISLTSSGKVVDSDTVLKLDQTQTNFYLSSSTVYSNTSVHGTPVVVSGGAQLNLSDGFTYQSFNIEKFEIEEYRDGDGSEEYLTAETLGLTKGANVIAAAKSAAVTKSEDSAELALSVGTDDVNTAIGNLYISGNSAIYGVTRLYLYSVIAQTGKITSNVATKIDFGENIANFATQNGNYPLYWAGGSEDTTKDGCHFETEKFAVYGNAGYKIGDSGRKVNEYGGENKDNTIYAPLAKN